MAYVPLNATDIQAGKPVKEELFDTIRDNQDDFNTRITATEQTSKIDIFDIGYTGEISQYSAGEIGARTPIFKAPLAAQMVSFIVTLVEASTSGNLEVEIDRSTDNGINWTPLLNNPVTVSGTTVGSISGTVDWVDVPSQSFAQNNLLRIRITGTQVDQGAFHVSVYGELS